MSMGGRYPTERERQRKNEKGGIERETEEERRSKREGEGRTVLLYSLGQGHVPVASKQLHHRYAD